MKKRIRLFKFYKLKLSDFFELSHFIFGNVLTPDPAQILGIAKAYNEAKASFDKLTEIFRRNPALLLTGKLVENIAMLRRKMNAFRIMLKMLDDVEGERLENVKILNNVAHPYLKNITHDTQTALSANGIEMADALRTPANLPRLTQLELKNLVDDIATLAHATGEKLLARGEEKVHRKELGNATNTRKKLEKQLRFLFYSAIPAHYAEAAGALITTFEHTIMDINGALESFRHLIPDNNRSSAGKEESQTPLPSKYPEINT
ncbi:MAG: DUF6261 family protein [Mediterranea sp.]|jgi:hypothetical protein|nr:DUF6261 family protein [Mediterranea sp.]